MTCLDDLQLPVSGVSSVEFPAASSALETFGLKFSSGGAHISRTMMMQELGAVLANVPQGSGVADYRDAILRQNILGKTTDTTRQKSLRHLRELYALDEAIPIFGLLRKLYAMDVASLPLLAVQVAWSRDPLLRATTVPVTVPPPSLPIARYHSRAALGVVVLTCWVSRIIPPSNKVFLRRAGETAACSFR